MKKFIDILGNEIEFECLGCEIANHTLIPPGGYVYEDDFINVSADPEIPIKGFMVLGINKHIKSINDMSNNERTHIMDILNKTIDAIKKANIANEVLVVQEERSDHFHIWIVPILDWMKEFGNSVVNIKEIISFSKENFDNQKKCELLNAIEDIKIEFNK